MAEQTDPTGLPPEQEAVRRLLAGARHDGPTPPEVVARLDATLSSLAAERREAPTPVAPVVDLGARRRRLAGMGLLAAAAVVVAGVAIGQGLPPMGGFDAGSASDGEAGTSQRDFDDGAGGGAASEEAPESSLKSSAPAPLATYPTLSSDDADLDDDLVALRSTATYDAQASESLSPSDSSYGCDLGDTGRGRRVLAVVDGRAGVVVFRRTDEASQQVDLYVCGDAQAVRTLTLPAP